MSYQTYVCNCAICAGLNSYLQAGGDALSADSGVTLPAAPTAPVVTNPITGDYRIDTLLQDDTTRWNHSGAMGTPVTVTYSFMTAKPTYGGTDSGTDTGFAAFNAEQVAATRQIFTKLQAELGIRFTEVSDSVSSYGQIRLGNNTQTASGGYAYFPNSTWDDKSGDIWINKELTYNVTNLAPGTSGYGTLVHEIGHAIGLKHPGNYNAGEAASTTPGNYLGSLEDNANYSIMSYWDAVGGQNREWFGIYDLLALKKLYGSGTLQAGNTTYTFNDAEGFVLSVIDDSGGVDTIDASLCTTGITLDLNPGKFSSIGTGTAGAAINNVSIDFSTTVENVIGTARNDVVVGNTANNTFTLGAGANTADGGNGIDTEVYSIASSAIRVAASGATLTVTGVGFTDSLTNIERLAFRDTKLAFDLNGNAGTTAKVLGAIFGKAAVANKTYVGIGIQLLDGGMSYVDLMQAALNVRLGVGFSNAAEVNLLYQNLIGVLPGATELAQGTRLIDAGTYTQATLGVFVADHAINLTSIDLVGLATTGLAYG